MYKTVGSTNLRTLWMSYMNVPKGKGEGRIGLAACLREMSASSCFLNEPGWGREALFTSTPAGQEGEEANANVSWFQSNFTVYCALAFDQAEGAMTQILPQEKSTI